MTALQLLDCADRRITSRTFECGGACDWWGCVGGGEMFINSSRECTVGVRSGTWTQAKRLYE